VVAAASANDTVVVGSLIAKLWVSIDVSGENALYLVLLTSMGIQIRSADLREDKELLISTLLQHLTAGSDERRYEWLYLRNPEGPARAWLAVDNTSGKTVGVSAAFPRRIVVNGESQAGWVHSDFCLSGASRSLGPDLKLQKAT